MKIQTTSPDAMWSHIAITSFLEILKSPYQNNSKFRINVASKGKEFMVSIVARYKQNEWKTYSVDPTIEQAAYNCASKLNEKYKEVFIK